MSLKTTNHMRTINTNIYTFEELTPAVQKIVLNQNREILTDFDWYRDTVKEDAIGTAELKITAFSIYEDDIETEFTTNAKSSALRVISEHGDTCVTYSIAKDFLSNLEQLERKADTAQTEAEIKELEEKYQTALSREYLHILECEYEELQSDSALIEHFDCNRWEFYTDGRKFKS